MKYVIKFSMQELMPYESIVHKNITDKCKKIFNIANKYGIKNYSTEFPFILFIFTNREKALDFFIETKKLVNFIDIAKGDDEKCQEEN